MKYDFTPSPLFPLKHVSLNSVEIFQSTPLLVEVMGGGGGIVPFAVNFGSEGNSAICGKFFDFSKIVLKINPKRHLLTIYHIFCFGTGLQVDSYSGEGCAGFSKKEFATYAKPK